MGSLYLVALVFIGIFLSYSNAQFTTIAVVGINDIHGTALPTYLERQYPQKQAYTYGGLMYMASLIEIIKSQYPGHTLILDAGDQIQGGIQSSPMISNGKIMNDFYNAVEANGNAVGNHQFDFGPDILFPYLKSRESITLAANLQSQKGDIQFLPQQKLSHMYQFSSGLKVGVIGLATIQTPFTTNAFKNKLFPEYKFLNYTAIVIEQSKKLKKSGANAVLVLSHVGNGCVIGNTYGKWTNQTKQPPCTDNNDQITQLIDSLPSGTIDGVVQGHRHKFAHHFYKNVAYMGNINGGFYFNVMYLKFLKNKLIETMIQGPIAVCDKIFANLGTCQYLFQDKQKIAGELVDYRFHNKLVTPHPKVKAIYQQQWVPRMKDFLQFIASTQIYLQKKNTEQNQLSNLIAILMHKSVPQVDFTILNTGSLRTVWYPGNILFQNVYNMFPFQNVLISFQMTGAEIIQMLTIVQSGNQQYYPMDGIDIVVGRNQKNINRFISAKFYNGDSIQPDKVYRGLTNDFLIQGGDNFKNFIGKYYTPRKTINHGLVRQNMKAQLQLWKTVEKDTLINKDHPRYVVISE